MIFFLFWDKVVWIRGGKAIIKTWNTESKSLKEHKRDAQADHFLVTNQPNHFYNHYYNHQSLVLPFFLESQ